MLKDWKISTKNIDSIIWETRDSKYVYSIEILKVLFGQKTSKWKIDTLNAPPNAPHFEKYFKTKSQALKYAKVYMRKN